MEWRGGGWAEAFGGRRAPRPPKSRNFPVPTGARARWPPPPTRRASRGSGFFAKRDEGGYGWFFWKGINRWLVWVLRLKISFQISLFFQISHAGENPFFPSLGFSRFAYFISFYESKSSPVYFYTKINVKVLSIESFDQRCQKELTD